MKFLIIGGDARQAEIANLLFHVDQEVSVCALEHCDGIENKIEKVTDVSQVLFDVLILPMPVTQDGITVFAPFAEEKLPLDKVLNSIKSNQRVFGGRIGKALIKMADSYKIKLCDYFEREELQLQNAVATAEGCAEIAINRTKRTIFKSNVLVCGYGRCGKAITRLFKGLNANVYVAARRLSDLAAIETAGLTPVVFSEIERYAQGFDIIINTVPAAVIDEKIISRLKRSALIIDIASLPGGVNFESANKYRIDTVHALSIPGKTAPISTAQNTLDTILNILEETE